MNAWCLSRWAPLTDLHPLRLSYPECYLNYLMTLLCHDKVHCSTRELRDEPLPVVSDLLFLLKTSSKMPHNLTKLRHWLPLQHPVALGFPPRGFYQVLTRFFGLALSKPLSSGASVMPTAGSCVRNGKWSCRLRSSHRPPPPASGTRSGPFQTLRYSADWGWNQRSGRYGFLRHHLMTLLLLLTWFFSCFWQ